MQNEMGIFEGYMEIQYAEGKQARNDGLGLDCNPYAVNSEMGNAWIDGWNEEQR